MTLIRPATREDLPAIMAIDATSNTSAWSLAWWQSTLQSDLDTVLVAHTETGDITAFIVWQTVADEIELHLIVTAADYQRQGIAKTLMQQMFQAALEKNVARILLEVRVSNQTAQALYRKLGFAQIAVRTRYYRDGEDAVIMEKAA